MDRLNQQALMAELQKTTAEAKENLAKLQYLNDAIKVEGDSLSLSGGQGGKLVGGGQPVLTWDAQGSVVFTGKVMYNNKELSESFAGKGELVNYARKSDLSNFLTRRDLPTPPNLAPYALKTDVDGVRKSIPVVPAGFNFGNVALKADVDAVGKRIPTIPVGFDFTQVARKSELPNVANFMSKTDPQLSTFALKARLATPACSQKTTPASAWGAFETHNIDCPTGQVLKRIKANKLANGQLQYQYDCCSYAQ